MRCLSLSRFSAEATATALAADGGRWERLFVFTVLVVVVVVVVVLEGWTEGVVEKVAVVVTAAAKVETEGCERGMKGPVRE